MSKERPFFGTRTDQLQKGARHWTSEANKAISQAKYAQKMAKEIQDELDLRARTTGDSHPPPAEASEPSASEPPREVHPLVQHQVLSR